MTMWFDGMDCKKEEEKENSEEKGIERPDKKTESVQTTGSFQAKREQLPQQHNGNVSKSKQKAPGRTLSIKFTELI